MRVFRPNSIASPSRSRWRKYETRRRNRLNPRIGALSFFSASKNRRLRALHPSFRDEVEYYSHRSHWGPVDESELPFYCAGGSNCVGADFRAKAECSKARGEGSSGCVCFLEVCRYVQSRRNCGLGPRDRRRCLGCNYKTKYSSANRSGNQQGCIKGQSARGSVFGSGNWVRQPLGSTLQRETFDRSDRY